MASEPPTELALVRKLKEQAETLRKEVDTLKSGGGGGTFGGMDGRVSRLESDMDHVKKQVDRIDAGVSDIKKSIADSRLETTKAIGEVKGTLAAIEERTKHLPTRWEVFVILAAVIAAIGTVVALTARFLPSV